MDDVGSLLTAEVIRAMGITRVGDLTGLDSIGLPVWFASRPNSRSISVSQGKGLNDEQARVSAIMEAIEGAVAERPRDLVTHFASPGEFLHSSIKIVPLDAMARCDFSALDLQRERGWVKGASLLTGETVVAPYELIGLDMRTDFPWDRACFHMTSHGLAAGPDFAFAAVHGLEELIENDAVARVTTSERGMRPISYRSGEHDDLDQAVAKLRRAGIDPRFFDITGPAGIPVICASIPRDVSSPSGSIVRVAGGFASRLDPRRAALAALLEAVQSRLTDIAGARDDIPRRRYREAAIEPQPHDHPPISFDELTAGRPVGRLDESNLAFLCRRLFETGASDIYAFHLCAKPAHVVRVLVPGLLVETPWLSRGSSAVSSCA